jgi:hypothetical protein
MWASVAVMFFSNSRDEFWQTWNKANYDAVKAITDPDNLFRDLYTKTCKAAMGIDDAA